MPIDINQLRDYKGGDPEAFRKHMAARFKPVEWVDDVLAADAAWREAVKLKDDTRKAAAKIQKEKITPKKKAKQPCDAEVAEYKVRARWWERGGLEVEEEGRRHHGRHG